MTKPIIHVTADVPVELVKRVDKRVEELGVTRSFAIRKGLSLFLSTVRQDLTEIVITSNDAATETETENAR